MGKKKVAIFHTHIVPNLGLVCQTKTYGGKNYASDTWISKDQHDYEH
jgi:hypothetical protein